MPRSVRTNRAMSYAVGAADGAAPPPPLPDVLGGEARVELRAWRWVIAIAEPQQGANSTIRRFTRTIILLAWNTGGRLVAFIPPGTHVVLVIQVFASFASAVFVFSVEQVVST